MDSYTKEEVREMFLKYAIDLAHYWAKQEDSKERICEGVVHSLLTAIDGCSMSFPTMDIVLRPHPDDKGFCIKNGERYFEDGMVINDDVILNDILSTVGKHKQNK